MFNTQHPIYTTLLLLRDCSYIRLFPSVFEIEKRKAMFNSPLERFRECDKLISKLLCTAVISIIEMNIKDISV